MGSVRIHTSGAAACYHGQCFVAMEEILEHLKGMHEDFPYLLVLVKETFEATPLISTLLLGLMEGVKSRMG
ncbi:hypothetical protein PRIC1_008855 [Phytophthora ramorum]|uniref:uncharacterized protein n=1 Tax=Phytophthora ramorum TaxID=164328 RepID=UPI00309E1BDD|nr:hypothetical protein KRP23_6393 [Phytophthora ramorum]KAH7505287.1 hypothetical protein KRP22_5761 [Phytophthora ramorum]